MPLLHIALHDGFASEAVAIAVDGREIFRKDEVRTRTQIGFADKVELDHASGPASVEITARGKTTRIAPTLNGDVYLGVSIAPDGQITHRVSAQPFGYV